MALRSLSPATTTSYSSSSSSRLLIRVRYSSPFPVFSLSSSCPFLCPIRNPPRTMTRDRPLPLPLPPLSSLSPACMSSRRTFSTGRRREASPRTSLMDVGGFGETLLQVREAVGKVCEGFPDEYWAERDDSGTYPFNFHARLATDGWIGIALPEELGGAGLGISEATMMMLTISESGAGMAGAQSIHANVYATQPVAKFGTPSQVQNFLPPLIKGTSRACFGVTEPNTGLDTLKLKTRAIKSADGTRYSITGQKIWISSAQVASHMILLARTTPLEEVTKPSEGLSLFFIPLTPSSPSPSSTPPALTLHSIPKMGARAIPANEVFFDAYPVPASSLIGPAGHGFRLVLHGLNSERCLLAGEALGLGYAALEKAARYARDRVVFGRAIGKNQGIAHPLAEAWMALEAAKGVTFRAAGLWDRYARGEEGGQERGGEKGSGNVSLQDVGVACNMAKYLAAEAAFKACERAVLTLGGMGYAREYHVERYLRECFIPRIAPVSREMVLNFIGERVLGLPRSY